MAQVGTSQVIRFGTFEVDLHAYELRKGGLRLKLTGQPFQVLAILLERPGSVVTREELQSRLWPDTFVDVDHNLNTAINKIRVALGDSSENPRFVETLPRRGYRFIAPVSANGTAAAMEHAAKNRLVSGSEAIAGKRTLHVLVLLGAVILLGAGGLWILKRRAAPAAPPQRTFTRLTFDEGLQNEPNWSPDGQYIAFSSDRGGKFDIWVQQVSGGDPVQVTKGKLEIAPAVQKKLAEVSGEGEAGEHEQLGDYSFSWSPSGDAIYFERGYRGARNIWKMTVDPKTQRATEIDRLTIGSGPDAGVAVSTDGRRLAFTAKSQRIRAWLFPFDATTGHITGNGEAITSPGRTSAEPTLSRDGTKLAYYVPHGESLGRSSGDVRNEVWLKSLVDGREVPVIADDYSRWMPQWSPDGMQLAYQRRNRRTDELQLMVWSSQSHEEESLGSTRLAWDWSPDGKWLLSTTPNEGIWSVPVAEAPHAEVAAKKIISPDPAYQIYQPHFSPNGRWIVFEAVANSPSPNPVSTLYVVPASGGPWTRITDSKHCDDKPRWSPDGRTIYFVSRRGGFFNVWGIHFALDAGKTVGQPFQVSKFESPRLMVPRWIPPVGLSLTQDKLVLTMAEESGSIWVLDNVDR